MKTLCIAAGLLGLMSIGAAQTAPTTNAPFREVIITDTVTYGLPFSEYTTWYTSFEWTEPDYVDWAYYGSNLFGASGPSAQLTGTLYVFLDAGSGLDGSSPASGEVGEEYDYAQHSIIVGSLSGGSGG